jgi:hypothetical protein
MSHGEQSFRFATMSMRLEMVAMEMLVCVANVLPLASGDMNFDL